MPLGMSRGGNKSETAKFKFMLYSLIVFAASAYASCTELKYAIWGEEAEAKITTTNKAHVSGRRGSSREVIAVKYEWAEEGGLKRKDVVNMPAEWQRPSDDRLAIEYLPGVKGSRMQGERNDVALVIFFVATGGVLFFVVKTWREAYR